MTLPEAVRAVPCTCSDPQPDAHDRMCARGWYEAGRRAERAEVVAWLECLRSETQLGSIVEAAWHTAMNAIARGEHESGGGR